MSTVYTLLPNMSKKSATHQKKVESAVRNLQTTTGVKVPQAMILARFSKSDVTNETVRRMIQWQGYGSGKEDTGGNSNGGGTGNN
jgi:hypothetical protein